MHHLKIEFARLVGRILADRWHKTTGAGGTKARPAILREHKSEKTIPAPREQTDN